VTNSAKREFRKRLDRMFCSSLRNQLWNAEDTLALQESSW
jgi:hypothetical protein